MKFIEKNVFHFIVLECVTNIARLIQYDGIQPGHVAEAIKRTK